MSRWLKSTLIVLGVLVGIFVAGFLIFRFFLVPRSFPEVEGRIDLPGLLEAVDIYRDAYGVPHIYATNEHDLFMAQGFVHAQERFWQMDVWRHASSGRLSELVGESQIESDIFLRSLGWARTAEKELETMDPALKANLEAYAEGVNYYLASNEGTELSLEYLFLGLLNPGYTPEPWTPVNSLTWGKAMAWQLGGDALRGEIQKAILLKKLGVEKVNELFPNYPIDHPHIVPGYEGAALYQTADSVISNLDQLSIAQLSRLEQQVSAVLDLTGEATAGIGSNSWVVSGEKSTTGAPIFSNDPHLPIQMPSIWFENGLHCEPISEACDFNVVGFSFAGIPFTVIGHNDHIVWGLTTLPADVGDLYLERINPENLNQYEVNGQWQDMTLIEDTVFVAGAEAQDITIRLTRHGPLLSDVDDELSAFSNTLQEEGYLYGLSYQWNANEPSTIYRAIRNLNLASNWEEFQNALRDWDIASHNVLYADVDGNIGYQSPGRIPIRASGAGDLPVPGWTDEYEWIDYIPFEQLPSLFNPEEGVITTANNAVIGPTFPFYISSSWDYGYRAERITTLLGEKTQFSIEDMQRIQGDNFNPAGPILVPILRDLSFDELKYSERISLLNGWDYQNDMDSAAAAMFNVVWRHLMLRTFADDIPLDWIPQTSKSILVMEALVTDPTNDWWDDRRTPMAETRDDILKLAVMDAVKELEETLGEDPAKWSWGILHGSNFETLVMGQSGIGLIESIFNRGPFPTAGGESIVNATGWDYLEDYTVDWLPSHRMIVDLANFENSLSIHTTGQSGHVYHPHYIDMADLWRTIQYHPMLWSRDQIRSSVESHLKLRP